MPKNWIEFTISALVILMVLVGWRRFAKRASRRRAHYATDGAAAHARRQWRLDRRAGGRHADWSSFPRPGDRVFFVGRFPPGAAAA